MSHLEDTSIAFSISNDQQSFRLLELPTSLLELITAEQPPILYLKSEPVNSTAPSAPAPTAVVCTHDLTFEIRQVQSSNILYLIEPSSLTSSIENDLALVSGVTAIGQCKALLELVPIQTQPILFLKDAIPVYSDERAVAGGHQTSSKSRTKHALIRDMPFSTGEFDSAWTELCAFESEHEVWRPSALLLRDIWASFVAATIVQGIDITSTTSTTSTVWYKDVVRMVMEDGFPEVVLQAMFRRLESDQDNTVEGGVLIDRSKCVSWLGLVLLEALSQEAKVSTSGFLQVWQDQLPERWREDAKLDLLQASFTDLGNDSLIFKGKMSTITNRDVQVPTAATTSKGKSKWHEKFKATRT